MRWPLAPVDSRRISLLLAPFLESPLTDAQLQQVAAYLALLLRWNARMNLTAVRAPEQIVARHFGESFFAARHFWSAPPAGVPGRPGFGVLGWFAGFAKGGGFSPSRVIDLGSGAGFPGLPLKIYAPSIALTLIESNQKKATFLKEAARTLSFPDVNVFSGRAERFHSKADLVTLRAVERYERVLETAARLVSPGGRLALLIGSRQAAHTPQLLPSFSWNAPTPVPESASRVLLVGTNQVD